MSFEKYKVRVLTRGDKQKYPGETEGPVTRIETLLMLLSIAVHEDLEIFKIDIGSAFMRTRMANYVKHKWLRSDPLLVKILMDLKPDEYEPYVLQDGTVIVEMTKLRYGFVEAVHYWWHDLTETFK